MKFEILADGNLIGYSELEYGDPPMGVAHGVLKTTPAYGHIRAQVIASGGRELLGIALAARPTGESEALQCVGIGILDMSDEMPEPPRVEVLGIPYPEYGRLFPHHVADYENRFPDCGA